MSDCSFSITHRELHEKAWVLRYKRLCDISHTSVFVRIQSQRQQNAVQISLETLKPKNTRSKFNLVGKLHVDRPFVDQKSAEFKNFRAVIEVEAVQVQILDFLEPSYLTQGFPKHLNSPAAGLRPPEV